MVKGKVLLLALLFMIFFLRIVSAVTIEDKQEYYLVTTQQYVANVSKKGWLTELYPSSSPYSSLGYPIEDYPGVYLKPESSNFKISSNRSIEASNYIEFFNDTYGNWTFYFYEDKIVITVNVSGTKNLDFYFVPDVDYLLKVVNASGEEFYLKNWEGITNLSWTNVTFWTLENVSFRVYLSQKSESDARGYLEFLEDPCIQTWTIDENNGPSNLKRNNNYSITIEVDSTHIKPFEKVSIANGNQIEINSSLYTANLSKSGHLLSLYFENSRLNNFGDPLNGMDGIYLANSGEAYNLTFLGVSKNKVYFNSSVGYMYFTFFNHSIYVNVKPYQSEDLIFDPSIDAVSYVCDIDSGNCTDLGSGIGTNKEWTNVSFGTIENATINLKVLKKGDVTGAKAVTAYWNNNQIWGFLGFTDQGPYQLYANQRSKIEMNFNLSGFRPYDENLVNVTQKENKIEIETSNYTAELGLNGSLQSLYVKGSFLNLLGKVESDKWKGVTLLDYRSDKRIKANSYKVNEFKVGFYANETKWFYRFYPDRIQIIASLNSSANSTHLVFVPMIESMKWMANGENRSEVYDLFGEKGTTPEKTWYSAIFRSLEGSELLLSFLKSTDIAAKTQAGWVDKSKVEVWGLEDFSSGAGTPMSAGNVYSLQVKLNLTDYQPMLSSLNITDLGDRYNVSAGKYWRVVIYKNGSMKSMKIGKSTDELLLNGIYLSFPSNKTPIEADNSTVIGNKIYFFSPYGEWRYEFYNKKMYVVPKLSNISDLSFWFEPNITNFEKVFNTTNESAYIELGSCCEDNDTYNKQWSDVTYETNNEDFLRIYLYGAPVIVNGETAEGSIGCYYNESAHWALTDVKQPDAMRENGVYKIILDLKPRVSEVEELSYQYDNKTGKAYLFIPENYTLTSELPLVVCLHDFEHNASECLSENLKNESNKRNWLLLAVQGYGRVENESYYNGSSLGWIGFQHDVLSAIDYVEKNHKVNASRIYLLTFGSTSLVAAAKHPDVFAAGVALYPVSNLTKWKIELDNKNQTEAEIVQEEVGGNYTEVEFEYERRSPLYYYTNLKYFPLLLMRNESDETVNYTQSDELYQRLEAFGNVELRNLSYSAHNSSLANASEIFDFFSQHFLEKKERNLTIVYDESGAVEWINFTIDEFNSFGPDQNDMVERFCRINASYSNSSVEISTDNIKEVKVFLNRINVTDFNFTFSGTKDYRLEWEGREMNLSCSAGSSAEIVNYLPKRLLCQNFSLQLNYQVSRPFINESNFSLLGSEWEETSRKFNFTLNVTGAGSLILLVPKSVYTEGFYEVLKNGERIYFGNDTAVVINETASGVNNYTVEYETVPPTIDFVEPTPINGTTINTSWIFVNVTLNDTNPIDVCLLNFSSEVYEMQKSGYNCYYNVTGLNDTTWYWFFVEANDTLGNLNSSENRSVYVDYNNPPEKPELIAPNNNSYLPTQNITFKYNSSDSDEDALSYYVYVDGHVYYTNETELNLTLGDGEHNWYVIASDGQLNSTPSNIWVLHIDTVKPVITIITPENKTYENKTLALKVETDEFTTCNYSVDIGENKTMENVSETEKQASFNVSEEGPHEVSIYCWDRAGNENSTSVVFTSDFYSPIVELIQPGNQSLFGNSFVELKCYVEENVSLKNVSFLTNESGSFSLVYTNSSGVNGIYNYSRSYSDGIYRWGCKACDELRCKENSSYLFTVDTRPPQLNLISPEEKWYNSSQIELDYTVNDLTLDKCWYELDGNKYTLSNCENTILDVSDGIHELKLYANDSLGRVSSANVSFHVDTVKPTIKIYSPRNQTTYSQVPIWLNYSVEDQNPDKCWYLLNGQRNELPGCQNATLNLSSGSYRLGLYANDSAGNVNSSWVEFNVSLIWPAIIILNPENQSFVNSSDISVDYTVIDDDQDVCWYSLDDNANVSLSNCENFTLNGLQDGVHSIKIYANDTLGHLSVNSSYFTVDTVKPLVQIVEPENKTYNASSVSFRFSVEDQNPDKCWYLLNGQRNELPGCQNATLNLSSGSYRLGLYANDSAGNVNSSWVEFSVDITPPIIEVESPKNAWLNYTSVWFNLSSNEPLSKCEVSIDGNLSEMNRENSTFCYLLKSIDEGNHSAVFYAWDEYYNQNSTSFNFTVDMTPPRVDFLSPENKTYNASLINFTLITNEKCRLCELKVENESYLMGTTDNSTWHLMLYLQNKSYSAQARCWDEAGNTNSSNICFSIGFYLSIRNFTSDSNFGYINQTNFNFSFILSNTYPAKRAWLLFNQSESEIPIENKSYQDETINFTKNFTQPGFFYLRVCVEDEENNTACSNQIAVRIYRNKTAWRINVSEPVKVEVKRLEDKVLLNGLNFTVENASEMLLPNESLYFRVANLNNSFSVEFSSSGKNLSLKIRKIKEDRIHNVKLDLSYDMRYVPIEAYAFESPEISGSYVQVAFATSIPNAKIFKLGYSFESDKIDYENANILSPERTGNWVYAQVRCCSLFVLVEDKGTERTVGQYQSGTSTSYGSSSESVILNNTTIINKTVTKKIQRYVFSGKYPFEQIVRLSIGDSLIIKSNSTEFLFVLQRLNPVATLIFKGEKYYLNDTLLFDLDGDEIPDVALVPLEKTNKTLQLMVRYTTQYKISMPKKEKTAKHEKPTWTLLAAMIVILVATVAMAKVQKSRKENIIEKRMKRMEEILKKLRGEENTRRKR